MFKYFDSAGVMTGVEKAAHVFLYHLATAVVWYATLYAARVPTDIAHLNLASGHDLLRGLYYIGINMVIVFVGKWLSVTKDPSGNTQPQGASVAVTEVEQSSPLHS